MQQQSLPTYQINEQNLIYIVWVDELIHSAERPWCNDPTCPCKLDEALYREYAAKPIANGLMTRSEATRLFLGTQLTPTQDERISDEEIAAIMNEPSPLDVDIEENYHRPLRVSAQFQGMMDSLLIEHD